MSVIPFALVTGFALAAVAAALLAVVRAHAMLRDAERRGRAGGEESGAAVRSLRAALDQLSEQIQEARGQPPVVLAPALPRPGLNLSKRSQALRMHRRGDSPEQIAAGLEIPRQEVDLLLKVHRILLRQIA